MSIAVCWPNYLNTEAFSSLTATSENPEFPISNLEATMPRAKVWQSAGCFIITAANNQLPFRDTNAGAPLMAILTPGVYNSVAAFRTEIKAAMEAVGAAVYTITQNANKKLVFSSDLSGGATHFELHFGDPDSSIHDVLGFPAVNQTGTFEYIAPSVRIHTEERIVVDLGSAFNPKVFALYGPRNEPIRIQQGAEIRLEANATNFWDTPAFSQLLTWNEFSIALLTQQGFSGLAPMAYRYWSIKIVDRDNPRGYVEVSSVFLGQTLDIVRGCPQFPLDVQEVDLTRVEQALSGSSFSSMYGKTTEIALNWQFLLKAEMDQIRDMYRDVGKARPFTVVLDPKEAFSTDFERWVLQVKFDSDPTHALESVNRWSSTWALLEDV